MCYMKTAEKGYGYKGLQVKRLTLKIFDQRFAV